MTQAPADPERPTRARPYLQYFVVIGFEGVRRTSLQGRPGSAKPPLPPRGPPAETNDVAKSSNELAISSSSSLAMPQTLRDSLHSLLIPDEIAGDSSKLSPEVLLRCPPTDHAYYEFPQELAAFCRPRGWFLSASKKPAEFHTLALTDLDGNVSYGSVLTLWSRVKKTQYLSSVELDPEDPPTWDEDNGIAYLPRCYVFLSLFPNTALPRLTLRGFLALKVNGVSDEDVYKYIQRMMTEIPHPVPGVRLALSIGNEQAQAYHPREHELQIDDGQLDVTRLFDILPVHHVVAIYFALLVEQKVIIRGPSAALLGEVMTGLLEILRPLTFQFVCIPVLPRKLTDILSAPTPYLIGIDSEIEVDTDLVECVLVDIGQNTLMYHLHGTDGLPPKVLTERLEKTLMEIREPHRLHANRLKRPQEPKNDRDLERRLRLAFMRQFVFLTQYVATNSVRLRHLPQEIFVFEHYGYLREVSNLARDDQESAREFLRIFIGSTAFDHFMNSYNYVDRNAGMYDEVLYRLKRNPDAFFRTELRELVHQDKAHADIAVKVTERERLDISNLCDVRSENCDVEFDTKAICDMGGSFTPRPGGVHPPPAKEITPTENRAGSRLMAFPGQDTSHVEAILAHLLPMDRALIDEVYSPLLKRTEANTSIRMEDLRELFSRSVESRVYFAMKLDEASKNQERMEIMQSQFDVLLRLIPMVLRANEHAAVIGHLLVRPLRLLCYKKGSYEDEMYRRVRVGLVWTSQELWEYHTLFSIQDALIRRYDCHNLKEWQQVQTTHNDDSQDARDQNDASERELVKETLKTVAEQMVAFQFDETDANKILRYAASRAKLEYPEIEDIMTLYQQCQDSYAEKEAARMAQTAVSTENIWSATEIELYDRETTQRSWDSVLLTSPAIDGVADGSLTITEYRIIFQGNVRAKHSFIFCVPLLSCYYAERISPNHSSINEVGAIVEDALELRSWMGHCVNLYFCAGERMSVWTPSLKLRGLIGEYIGKFGTIAIPYGVDRDLTMPGTDFSDLLAADFERLGITSEASLKCPWYFKQDCNMGNLVCQSYPRAHVVPQDWDFAKFSGMAQYFKDSRYPMLSYYHQKNNTFLMRAAGTRFPRGSMKDRCFEELALMQLLLVNLNSSASGTRPQILIVMDSEVGDATGNTQKASVLYPGCELMPLQRVYDDEDLPLHPKNIHTAFDRFIKSFGREKGDYLHAIHKSNWLEYISTCISIGSGIADLLVNHDVSVLLSLESGSDLTVILSSLAQLLVDPYYRTIGGFCDLIVKEWAAYGHPFSYRHDVRLLDDPNYKVAPVFSLFVYCVVHVLRQYPQHFEFSQNFLGYIQCHATSGRFAEFQFQSEAHYRRRKVENAESMKTQILKITENQASFYNIFYRQESAMSVSEPLAPLANVNDFSLWQQFHLCDRISTFFDAVPAAVVGKPSELSVLQEIMSDEELAGPGWQKRVQELFHDIEPYTEEQQYYEASPLVKGSQCVASDRLITHSIHLVTHRFQKSSQLRARCDYCGNMLLSSSALRCRDCRYKVHENCAPYSAKACGSSTRLKAKGGASFTAENSNSQPGSVISVGGGEQALGASMYMENSGGSHHSSGAKHRLRKGLGRLMGKK
eukprot:Clim_evm55s232 gene=Clim_evmTU55s232